MISIQTNPTQIVYTNTGLDWTTAVFCGLSVHDNYNAISNMFKPVIYLLYVPMQCMDTECFDQTKQQL